MITINMDKARVITRNQLRAERTPLFSALDIEYQRADERGDEKGKAFISEQKQVLRDITQHAAIDEAKTPEELKVIRIENLITM